MVWAKRLWRTVVSLVVGAIAGGWVYFSAHTTQVRAKGGWWLAAAHFGSFWWATLFIVLAATLFGYNHDVARVAAPPED